MLPFNKLEKWDGEKALMGINKMCFGLKDM